MPQTFHVNESFGAQRVECVLPKHEDLEPGESGHTADGGQSVTGKVKLL